MSEFSTEWKETKVVMSVQEFDRYREMEKAVMERKGYRMWKDNGTYGADLSFSVLEESDVIKELMERVRQLNTENFELKALVAKPYLNKIKNA